MAKNVQYFRGDEEHPDEGRIARIHFDGGTLVVDGVERGEQDLLTWDERVDRHRAPALVYRRLVGALIGAGYTVVDEARDYGALACELTPEHEPYEHQRDAVRAWCEGDRRGVVVLPTGSGKSYVAQLAMDEVRRNTLIIAPTLDLVDQWHRRLSQRFGVEVGMLGGGQHEVEPITVSTYDSAAIHMDRLGGQFGLVVFDEVHHLPGDLYRQAAESAIAPFRLGLTATFERSDGRHREIEALVGPVVFRLGIKELSGDILADYRVETIEVEMRPEDAEYYHRERGLYRGFVRDHNVRMRGRHAWRNFLAATSRSPEGRRALLAHRNQKRIALAHENKLLKVEELLARHAADRIIVFTNDNDTVYDISQRFLCPTITHQTPIKERGEILERFSEGSYRVVVTSKVLNEGVDVPEANIAIILSGTGSVREHVQRLGRILRRSDQKKALLYELITADTVETHVSRRRREHDAYR